MSKKKILIIEDEKTICRELTELLTNEGYEAEYLEQFDNAKNDILEKNSDLLLLDINIPGINGEMLLREIRKTSDVPIIMVTSRTGETDEVLSMSYGADDYITKPFGSEELLARIRTALRHSAQIASTGPREIVYSRDGLVIDFDKRVVMLNGEDIHLTQIEYKLVSLLAKNAGKVLTYDFILKESWGAYADTDNQILRVNMANIRRKLESNPAEPHYIFTEIGVGYRMKE